jgi:Holliday junction resolvase RusA-like endonuclease
MSEVLIKCAFPPSSNNAYQNLQRGGRRLTDEAKKWKRDFQWLLKAAKFAPVIEEPTYSLTLAFLAPQDYWYTKAYWPKKRDLNNLIKLAEDAISEHLGIDDSRFFESHHYKQVHPNGEFWIKVEI